MAVYNPIAWQSLSATTATVTFSSIPGTWRDLRLVMNFTCGGGTVLMTYNSDTGANYNYTALAFDGQSVSATYASQTAQTSLNPFVVNEVFSNTVPQNAVIDLLDYSSTAKFKTFVSRYNVPTRATNSVAGVNGGEWSSTAAITNISITASANFNAGSTFALYGIQG